MYTDILVASDLSARSERALRRAMALAAQHGARLTLLHVVDEDLPAAMAQRMQEEAEADLARLCASISTQEVAIRVEIADPAEAIARIAGEGRADLLVMGVHRPRPVLDLFSGTTMERIVRAVTLPVLLVRDPNDHDYDAILAGIDLSPSCGAALRAAAALVPAVTIRTFHAFHIPYRGMIAPTGSAEALRPFLKEAQRALDEWWETADLPATCEKPVPEAIGRTTLLMRRMEEHDPDLLVIGAHGRPSFAPTLLGGFTEEILRAPPCDVLIVRR